MRKSLGIAFLGAIMFAALSFIDWYGWSPSSFKDSNFWFFVRGLEIVIAAAIAATFADDLWPLFLCFQGVPLVLRVFIQSPLSSAANNLWPLGVGIEFLFSGLIFIAMIFARKVANR